MLALHDPQLAHLVLHQYGLTLSRLELLNDVRHVTYHVHTVDGRHFSLRVCPAAPQTKDLLEDELLWLNYVAHHHQVRVPIPVQNRAGTFLTAVDHHSYLACLYIWLPGQPATGAVTLGVLYELGRAMATLHRLARCFPVPPARPFRPDFYYDSRLAQAHHTWLAIPHAARTAAQSAIVDAAIAFVLDAFTRLGTNPAHFGLIHADIHLGNVILHDTQVAIIDFEQLGWGYYGYDLAVLYTQLVPTSATEHEWSQVLAGYQMIAPLPFSTADDFAPFLVAVHLAFLDWVYNAHHPAVWREQSPRIPAVYAALETVLGRPRR